MSLSQSVNKTFLKWIGPAGFSGVTLSDWLRLLRENQFAIDAPYLGRATLISMLSVGNSLGASLENFLHGQAIEVAEVQPPLFVLGCWRSGTTHLHNLLSKDERFAYPSTYQVMNPHVFLTHGWWNAPLQSLFFPKKRMMDNVRLTPSQPQEDEFMLAGTCGMSPMNAMCFWRNREHYNRFTTMKDVSDQDLQSWKISLTRFFKKLTVKYNKPLVVKSPAHTARIALLLEMFPEARFINLHRNPYDVFVSAVHMYGRNLEIMALQRFNKDRIACNVIRHFGSLFHAYFEQRQLIPEDRLIEISYQELDQDPVGTLRRTYEHLDLPDFQVAEPKIREYVDSLASYEKNQHHEIEPRYQRKVSEDWARCFDEWGYAR